MAQHHQRRKSDIVRDGIYTTGKTSLIFIDSGVEINKEVYRKEINETYKKIINSTHYILECLGLR